MEVGRDIGNPFNFGIEPEKLVSELRRFADAIENHQLSIQSVMQVKTNKLDDFEIKRLVITYAGRKD